MLRIRCALPGTWCFDRNNLLAVFRTLAPRSSRGILVGSQCRRTAIGCVLRVYSHSFSCCPWISAVARALSSEASRQRGSSFPSPNSEGPDEEKSLFTYWPTHPAFRIVCADWPFGGRPRAVNTTRFLTRQARTDHPSPSRDWGWHILLAFAVAFFMESSQLIVRSRVSSANNSITVGALAALTGWWIAKSAEPSRIALGAMSFCCLGLRQLAAVCPCAPTHQCLLTGFPECRWKVGTSLFALEEILTKLVLSRTRRNALRFLHLPGLGHRFGSFGTVRGGSNRLRHRILPASRMSCLVGSEQRSGAACDSWSYTRLGCDREHLDPPEQNGSSPIRRDAIDDASCRRGVLGGRSFASTNRPSDGLQIMTSP